jgi:hypothetical protein
LCLQRWQSATQQRRSQKQADRDLTDQRRVAEAAKNPTEAARKGQQQQDL